MAAAEVAAAARAQGRAAGATRASQNLQVDVARALALLQQAAAALHALCQELVRSPGALGCRLVGGLGGIHCCDQQQQPQRVGVEKLPLAPAHRAGRLASDVIPTGFWG